MECPVVAALSVADQTIHMGEQADSSAPSVEQGRRVATPKEIFNDGATDERGTT